VVERIGRGEQIAQGVVDHGGVATSTRCFSSDALHGEWV
jgi:hypothetical protein